MNIALNRSQHTTKSTDSAAEAAIDAALVQRFDAGDDTALLTIMERYQAKIFATVLNLLHNHADTEEIVQDTFIRAHRGLAKFRGDSSLATWLYRIAVNLARNRYWYFFRRRRQDSLSLDHALGEDNDATFADLLSITKRSDKRWVCALLGHGHAKRTKDGRGGAESTPLGSAPAAG